MTEITGTSAVAAVAAMVHRRRDDRLVYIGVAFAFVGGIGGLTLFMVLAGIQDQAHLAINHGVALECIDITPGLALALSAYAFFMAGIGHWYAAAVGWLFSIAAGFCALYWLVIVPMY